MRRKSNFIDSINDTIEVLCTKDDVIKVKTGNEVIDHHINKILNRIINEDIHIN